MCDTGVLGKEEDEMTTIWNLFFTFFKIGLLSIGGGYAIIPLIQEQVVNQAEMCIRDSLCCLRLLRFLLLSAISFHLTS